MAPASAPFEKVLIANRGEIACRLIRAARRLRIRSVAVYSTPDAHAPHARLADEAVHVGPAASAASYLDVDRIVSAARAVGAEALHPGYGFLSENPAFVRRLEREGVTFVGPPADAITKMGDKIMSKQIAAGCGVNVIPGFVGEIGSEEQAIDEARKIGYPVMVKASAGGGGKGMRVAHSDKEVREAYRLSKSEAAKAFDDDRMLIEKFVEKPRHIEIQIIGDKHGNYVHLGERECSIQRRNQKIIEESPSKIVDEQMRHEMGQQAIALAKAVNYSSAGTVECLVSGVDRSFYFLEMNTRLQVEHPVTEAVTGYDIPELMFRIAAGEELPFAQADVVQHGWSIEARVYAENPFRGFLPSLGTVFGYSEPTTNLFGEDAHKMSRRDGFQVLERFREVGFDAQGLRIDSGIEDGVVVSSYYDPLLSKVIAYGPDRHAAIDRLGEALDSYVIGGFQTNIPFLRGVTRNDRFRTGEITTNFVRDEYPDTVSVLQCLKADGFGAGITLNHEELVDTLSIVGKMYFDEAKASAGTSPPAGAIPSRSMFEVCDVTGSKLCSGELELMASAGPLTVKIAQVDGKMRAGGKTSRRCKIMVGCEDREVGLGEVRELAGGDSGVVVADVNGKRCILSKRGSTPHEGEGVWKVTYKGSILDIRVGRVAEEELVRLVGGWPVPKGRSDGLGSDGTVRAPMAGHVVSIAVQVGDAVGVGQEVIVLEAMKMQNSLKSDVAGVVRSIRNVRPGDAVSIDQPLIELEVL